MKLGYERCNRFFAIIHALRKYLRGTSLCEGVPSKIKMFALEDSTPQNCQPFLGKDKDRQKNADPKIHISTLPHTFKSRGVSVAILHYYIKKRVDWYRLFFVVLLFLLSAHQIFRLMPANKVQKYIC